MSKIESEHPSVWMCNELFALGDLIELRLIKARGGAPIIEQMWVRREKLPEQLKRLSEADSEGYAIYYGVCPRAREGGTKSDVATLKAFWCDIDNVDVIKAQIQISDAGLADASLLVSSGHGVHAYWVLNEPVVVTPDNADELEAINRGIAAKIGGDHCGDLPRILRLPGFRNQKNPAIPLPVDIAHPSNLRAVVQNYEFDAFSALAAPIESNLTISHDEPDVVAVDPQTTSSWHNCLQSATLRCEGDRSKAEFAVLCDMKRQGLSKDEIWSIVKSTGKFLDKGIVYFNQTIKKVAMHSSNQDGVMGTPRSSRQLSEANEQAVSANLVNSTLTPASTPEDDPFDQFRVSSIQQDLATWKPVEHVKSGIHQIDTAIAGFRIGSVHCICGKPGKGKTTLTVQCAANAAAALVPTAVISLELARPDMYKLALAQESSIPRNYLDQFDIRGANEEKLALAKQEMCDWPLWICDSDAWKGPMDRRRLETIVAIGAEKHGWKLIVVDYLGLVANCQHDQGQYVADIENSTALKAIARKYQVAMVVVASLRKAANFKSKSSNGAAGEPSLDDLLGAGRLAYDAVNVLYIDSEKEKFERGVERRGKIHITVLKSRYSGASASDGLISLPWYPSTGRITNDITKWNPESDAA